MLPSSGLTLRTENTQSRLLNTQPQESYLLHFAHIHESFRKPEIDSLADLHHIPLAWIAYSETSPYAVISLPSYDAAKTIIRRSVLAKGIYALWSDAPDYTELHSFLRDGERLQELVRPHLHASFKFNVESFHHRRSQKEQRELIESFAYLGLQGVIEMKDPQSTFCIFEEFDSEKINVAGDKGLKRVALGLWIADGSRGDIDVFDLKKRHYIGTTSMDAELSLVTGNMALAGPGKIIYDPFVGTGSFILAASHWGATTLGSDIDGRQIRGKKGRSVVGNFKQYKISDRYLDGFVSDLTNSPLRKSQFLDAVICDPPYGVREGLKVLGHRNIEKDVKKPVLKDGIFRYMEPDYVPSKKPYSFLAILDDILQFAVDHLVDGGRLCFWMPAANEATSLDVPMHTQLELISVSVQKFNKWSRCLITYSRKRSNIVCVENKFKQRVLQGTADELNDFRKKYFEGFRSS